MRKKTLLFLLCILWISNLAAQSNQDSLKIVALRDSIADLYEKYFALSKTAEGVENKYKVLENQAQGNTEQLAKISSEDKRTLRTIYENNRLSIVATANYMDAVNDALNAFEFSASSLDYSNSIFELNNPTNSDLGFSLDKVVLQLVDEKIIRGKFKRKFGNKLRGILSGIINNPIINNPITQAIVSTVPAVSSITSVFNVVNSVAVEQPEIGEQALVDFNKELQKYIAHYEALAKASRDLDFNLNNLKLKTESVRKLAHNFIVEGITDLYAPEEVTNIPKMEMNDLVDRHYNYATVVEYIQKIERSNKLNYKVLSKRIVFPVVGHSKVSFIGEEIEKLYNEYMTTLSTYHGSIVKILNNATKLSEDKNKITKKINLLDKQYEILIKAYDRNVNMKKIQALEKSIPRY